MTTTRRNDLNDFWNMQQLSPCYFFAVLKKMENFMEWRSIQRKHCAFKAIALQSENNTVL